MKFYHSVHVRSLVSKPGAPWRKQERRTCRCFSLKLLLISFFSFLWLPNIIMSRYILFIYFCLHVRTCHNFQRDFSFCNWITCTCYKICIEFWQWCDCFPFPIFYDKKTPQVNRMKKQKMTHCMEVWCGLNKIRLAAPDWTFQIIGSQSQPRFKNDDTFVSKSIQVWNICCCKFFFGVISTLSYHWLR